MTTSTFLEVQRLVDQLTPVEQVRLLEYITPKIARAIDDQSIKQNATASDDYDATWQAFFEYGDSLRLSDVPTDTTVTELVSQMRR